MILVELKEMCVELILRQIEFSWRISIDSPSSAYDRFSSSSRTLPPSSYGVKKLVVCATTTDPNPCATTSMGGETKCLAITVAVLVLTDCHLRLTVSKVAPP
jgi:hypothetical protein